MTAQREELELLRASVRRFVAEHGGTAAARELATRGEDFDRDLWRRLGTELGVHGVHLPEFIGGQGSDVEVIAVVVEEFGRSLWRSPYVISQAIVGTVVSELLAGEDVGSAATWLATGIATGEVVATLALWEIGGAWDPLSTTVRAAGRSRVSLTGQKIAVPFGASTDWLVLFALDSVGDPVVAALEAGTAGVSCHSVASFDLTAPLANLDLEGAMGIELARGERARAAARTVMNWGALMRAVELRGSTRACLDSAVAYALVREQFGRVIGSQQAIKHLCANVLVEFELASAAIDEALAAVSIGHRVDAAVSRAKVLASEASMYAADTALHVHGGMGFTWEHDSHLYLRRARSASADFGDSRFHRERFLVSSGLSRDQKQGEK